MSIILTVVRPKLARLRSVGLRLLGHEVFVDEALVGLNSTSVVEDGSAVRVDSTVVIGSFTHRGVMKSHRVH